MPTLAFSRASTCNTVVAACGASALIAGLRVKSRLSCRVLHPEFPSRRFAIALERHRLDGCIGSAGTPGPTRSRPGGRMTPERCRTGSADHLTLGPNSGRGARRSSTQNISSVGMIAGQCGRPKAIFYFLGGLGDDRLRNPITTCVATHASARILSRDLGIRGLDLDPGLALLLLAAPTPAPRTSQNLCRPRQFCVPYESQEMVP
jgi:hypothetical protein